MRDFSTGIGARLKLLRFWLASPEVRRRVPLADLVRNGFTPRCETIARRFASPRGEDERYTYWEIAGYDGLFSYPRSSSYHSFAQVVSEGMLAYHWHHYETPETSVREGDVVVDCGSSEGFFAFKHAARCRHIYCIEPLPVFGRALHKLFDHLGNVTVIEAALSDAPGHLYLSPASINSACRLAGAEEGDIRVEAVTVDSLFAEKSIPVDYLKADLEGFEEMMIKGALETIRMSRPRIVLTTYHPGQNAQSLIDHVRSVVPQYRSLLRGIEETAGNPVMLHMWCP